MKVNETPFESLPSRIQYYLLEWKDDHLNEYIRKYGELKLKDMTRGQLCALFSYATNKDYQKAREATL